MRKLIRYIISKFFIIFGIVRRKNNRVLSENLITSIYFHNPSKELFEKCIKWLIANKYHFISTDSLYDILIGKKKAKRGSVCLTVDDGKKDNLDNIIPLISELNIPVTIFISTEPVENGVFWWSFVNKHNECNNERISIEWCKKISNVKRKNIISEIKTKIDIPREAMTKEDVIRISKLSTVTIGNHTVNHPITQRCEIDELKYEITEASKVLRNWTEDEIDFFAYPNGDFDGREVPILMDSNIKLAFTTVPEHIDSTQTINPFQVPRFCVNDNGSFSENICKMTGVWQKYIN